MKGHADSLKRQEESTACGFRVVARQPSTLVQQLLPEEEEDVGMVSASCNADGVSSYLRPTTRISKVFGKATGRGCGTCGVGSGGGANCAVTRKARS